jgi:hypothetical protein
MPPRLRRLLLALLALLVLAALLALLLANGLGPRPGPTPTEAAATPPAAAPTPQPAPTFTPQPAQVTAPPVVTTVATPPPQPKPKPPTINRFEVVAAQDGGRDQLMLSWDVSKDATDVKVLGQGGRPLVGTQPIEAVDDAEFDLEASNDGGTATRKVAIVLLRLPEISTLSASATDVDPGQAVTLTWMTRHAERADLNGETVTPAGGTRTEHPERSTTYTLVVENELGRVSQSVAVNVRGSPAVGAP